LFVHDDLYGRERQCELEFYFRNGDGREGIKPLTKEKSVGHNAYCSANGGLDVDAGSIKGAPSHLSIAADNSATDIKFAKAIFKRLS
jgi:hypothetical protein